MKSIVAMAFVAAWVVACGGSMHKAAAPSSGDAGAQTPTPSPMPGDPRNEIERLAAEIDGALATGGVATLTPAACELSHACTAAPMGLPPRAEDPTCKPAATDTCTQACTLSDSVCKNAERICQIAAQLGGADNWANEKCQSANDACARTRERCCGC